MEKLIQKLLPAPHSRMQLWRSAFNQRWQSLTHYQKLYFLAAIAIPVHSGVAAVLAMAGLTLDFWPRFVKAWESLAGKAVILLFYATVANFAYTSAAGLINDLTGVNAELLPYALNTALLLKLPAFALGISLLALVVLGLVFPFILIAIFLLRFIGVSHQRLFRNIKYPVMTLCLRFVLSWLLVVQAGDLLSPDQDADTEKPASEATSAPAATLSSKDINLVALDNSGYQHNVSRLLSLFIYHLEANSKSRCQLGENERAIEINDYQYLAIKQDKDAEFGLRYQVKACVSPGISLPQTAPLPQQ